MKHTMREEDLIPYIRYALINIIILFLLLLHTSQSSIACSASSQIFTAPTTAPRETEFVRRESERVVK